jgi:hypothetical protein
MDALLNPTKQALIISYQAASGFGGQGKAFLFCYH